MLESLLLSKVLDTNEFYALNKHNVNEDDFFTKRNAYLFIKNYVEENGQVPDVRTVSMKFEEFEYVPDIIDTFKYLCTELKNTSTKRRMFELLQTEASAKFSEMNGIDFTKWLKGEVERLERSSLSNNTLGIDFAKTGKERKELYLKKKENKDNIFIPTPYPSLTRYLNGGFQKGDYLLFLAFTNQGKTWMATHFGTTAAFQYNFNVLHYSVELTKDQQLDRMDTLNGHFINNKLARGELDNEQDYFDYLANFNEKNDKSYILKTMEDLKNGLTVEQIEEDLQTFPHTSVVIVDGFNLMRHKGGIKNMRNSLSQTSRDLRQLFVKYNVLGIVVHQTSSENEKSKRKKDDVEEVMVVPPSLLDYSETISTIQDASLVLTMSQREGIGKIAIEKARVPSAKGKMIDLHCDFNNGYITEVIASDYF